MKITKLGHCALVLEIDGVKILTDPGSFTTVAQEAQTGLDIILITHEHQDHYHLESVRKILQTNPQAIVVTNSAVGALLETEGIGCTKVGGGESAEVKGIKIEGFGKEHAKIYGSMPDTENTGYMLADQFYFPGDNFHNPEKPVKVLALPVAGPWMKISEAIDFAKEIKAPYAFGVHDGIMVPAFRSFPAMLMKNFLPDTEYVTIAEGESYEF